MMDPNDVLAERVMFIRELPSDQREQAIDTFLRDYDSMMTALARRMAAHSGGSVDEARSITLFAAWSLLAQGGDGPEIRNFAGLLTVTARSDYTRALDSERSGGVTGLIATQRRRRSLQRARLAYMREHGCPPSDDDLIAYHNANVSTRRSDAQGQGALASLDDLRPITPISLDVAPLGAAPDGGVLSPVEGNELVRRTIHRCAQIDSVLGQVAQAFLGGHLSHPGHVEQRVSFVARSARVPVNDVPILISRVQQVAGEVFREMDEG